MSEKTNILFVDDHQEILNGLKRMARSMRSEWNASFALGGEQALEMLSKGHFDVLVTDMRMPGIDGAQLLREVVKLYPHLIRIVLSGQYDVDSFIKSGWPAHRFLSKPCDADTLKQTITQTIAMRYLLDNQRLKDLVTRASYLPSLPGIYMEIEQELKSEETSMQKVGEIIAKDIGITAKILQLVNSPIFGCSRKIESPAQAVVMLGSDVVKSLTLYLQTCSTIEVPQNISLERISAHGVRIGNLAKSIAQLEGQDKNICAEAFLGGLLQNIGSLIIISSFPDEYQQIVTLSHEENSSVWEVEQRVLGVTHAEIGAYLISLWGLSPGIIEAVAYHNNPSECPDEHVSFALTSVHIANALNKDVGLGPAFIENEFDFEYLGKLGLLDHLPKWQELYLEQLRK